MSELILVPTAPGELIDKITILRIKAERITDPARLSNVKTELALMQETKRNNFPIDPSLLTEVSALEEKLKAVNEVIWDQSEKIRTYLESRDYNDEFVAISADIHTQNDRRAAVKKEINLLLNSTIIEEKSYKNWK
jgi:hypothetical protein